MERENQQPAALTALHLALQVGTICHLEAGSPCDAVSLCVPVSPILGQLCI